MRVPPPPRDLPSKGLLTFPAPLAVHTRDPQSTGLCPREGAAGASGPAEPRVQPLGPAVLSA